MSEDAYTQLDRISRYMDKTCLDDDYPTNEIYNELARLYALEKDKAQIVNVEHVEQRIVEWQPIETAPKDGTKILVNGKFNSVIAWFGADPNNGNEEEEWLSGDGDDFSCGYYYTPVDPTHWMPLPNPPANGASL